MNATTVNITTNSPSIIPTISPTSANITSIITSLPTVIPSIFPSFTPTSTLIPTKNPVTTRPPTSRPTLNPTRTFITNTYANKVDTGFGLMFHLIFFFLQISILIYFLNTISVKKVAISKRIFWNTIALISVGLGIYFIEIIFTMIYINRAYDGNTPIFCRFRYLIYI